MQDHALQVRLQHIVHCVEHREWPVSRVFSAYAGQEEAQDSHVAPRTPAEGSEVITITTDTRPHQQPAKRKRHIAIDVETERGNIQYPTCGYI